MTEIKIIESTLLKQFANIKHGFFSRLGGSSTGIYKSLNFGFGSEDNKEDIIKNYNLAAKHLNIDTKNIITVKQFHSNICIDLDKNSQLEPRYYDADALITNLPGLAISALTADCVPILLYAKDIGYISAIHAGWKGALCGIIHNTVKKLCNHGAQPNNIFASIMPSICQKSYEVDKIFYNKFLDQNISHQQYFIPTDKNKFLFNLRNYVIDILSSLNITQIDNVEIDTYSNENTCYSYRRATHKNQPDMGRHISFIYLENS